MIYCTTWSAKQAIKYQRIIVEATQQFRQHPESVSSERHHEECRTPVLKDRWAAGPRLPPRRRRSGGSASPFGYPPSPLAPQRPRGYVSQADSAGPCGAPCTRSETRPRKWGTFASAQRGAPCACRSASSYRAARSLRAQAPQAKRNRCRVSRATGFARHVLRTCRSDPRRVPLRSKDRCQSWRRRLS